MSNQALRELLDRINSDPAIREALQTGDARALLEDYDLSPAEAVALLSNDEDALRRLAGAREVSGYGLSIACHVSVLCFPTQGQLVTPGIYQLVSAAGITCSNARSCQCL
jgi:hypothetical protein